VVDQAILKEFTMHSSPRLARFPVGLFAIPVGLYALAGAWRRAQGLGWAFALPISQILAWSALTLLSLLLLVYGAKALKHPRVIIGEFTHPLVGSLLALIPLSLMMTTVYFGQAQDTAWLLFTLGALALQGVVALRIIGLLATGNLQAIAVTPALYLPPVAGGLVGAMAFSTLGYPGWAALLLGMGLAGWALLEARVLNRLFEGAMPEALRPTIGIELAPPAVATLAIGSIWPQLPGEVLIVGLGVAAGPFVAVMARWRWWSRIPFAIGFWSFSFPMAALAGAVIEVVSRGHWPPLVGGVALTIASAVIIFITAKTLQLIARGKLIPPPPPS
jgi:tellurite resistance protein